MAKKKEVIAQVKLQIPAGKANPAPPVGPALGPHGVNIMEFCKAFNAQTQPLGDTIVPVVLSVYADRSFTLYHEDPACLGTPEKGKRHHKGIEHPQQGKGRQGYVGAGKRNRAEKTSGSQCIFIG